MWPEGDTVHTADMAALYTERQTAGMPPSCMSSRVVQGGEVEGEASLTHPSCISPKDKERDGVGWSGRNKFLVRKGKIRPTHRATESGAARASEPANRPVVRHVARGGRRAASVVRGNMVGMRLVSLVLVLCGIEGAASLSPNLRPAPPPDLNEPYWPVSRNCQICSMLLVPLPPSCPRALCSACLAMRLLCLCPPEHRRLTSTPQAFALPALAALWASTPHPRTDVRLAGLRCSHA